MAKKKADDTSPEANADQLKADAEAATQEARRLSAAAADLHIEAQAKVDAANAAAEEAAREVVRLQSELADANAATKAAEAEAARARLAEAAAETAAAEAEAADAAGVAQALLEQMRPGKNYFRVEGGGWCEADGTIDPRQQPVRSKGGLVYDHVADHASGDWIYRNHRG